METNASPELTANAGSTALTDAPGGGQRLADDGGETCADKAKVVECESFIEEAFEQEHIVGLDSVKKQLKSFCHFFKMQQLREQEYGIEPDKEMSYSFVLYGNPGTGKTMVARVIGKMLFSLGIREKGTPIETDPSGLISEHVRETAKQTMAIIESARGGTLFIDEAYGLYKSDGGTDFGEEAINTLLKDMYDHRSEYSVIIAGYRDKMNEMLNHSNPGFRSRFKFHIDIPDYSDEDLIKIAHEVAKSKKYLIDADCDEAIRSCIERDRIDETFGNARYVTDLIEKSALNMADRLATRSFGKEDLLRLRPEDIWLPGDNRATVDELVNQLNRMVGLASVKASVQELIWTIETDQEMLRRGLRHQTMSQSLNMAFLGAPGTGKTTVARLIGRILGELGVLKRGDVFVECKRQDLVGMYIGHTARKTADAIRSALGGVLFIDEAYSLKGGTDQDFGQEAIDTLVGEMDNHRDSLVVILAGYPEKMAQMIKMNPGLSSRVTRSFMFEDYTVDDMFTILLNMIEENGFSMSEELYSVAKDALARRASRDDFGNSRGVRNMFEAIVRNQRARLGAARKQDLKDDDFSTILSVDIERLDNALA